MCNTGEAKKLNPRSKNHSNKTETNNINNQKTITESLRIVANIRQIFPVWYGVIQSFKYTQEAATSLRD